MLDAQSFSDEQETALNAMVDPKRRAMLRKVMVKRREILNKLKELREDDESISSWELHDELTNIVNEYETQMERFNIPIDGDRFRHNLEEFIVIQCTPIQKLNDWLTRRPSPEDIKMAISGIIKKAETNGEKEVLEQFREHVGDSEDQFVLKVCTQISEIFKNRKEARVNSVTSTVIRMSGDQPTASFVPNETNSQDQYIMTYATFKKECESAIESGEVSLKDECDDAENLDEADDEEEEEEDLHEDDDTLTPVDLLAIDEESSASQMSSLAPSSTSEEKNADVEELHEDDDTLTRVDLLAVDEESSTSQMSSLAPSSTSEEKNADAAESIDVSDQAHKDSKNHEVDAESTKKRKISNDAEESVACKRGDFRVKKDPYEESAEVTLVSVVLKENNGCGLVAEVRETENNLFTVKEGDGVADAEEDDDVICLS